MTGWLRLAGALLLVAGLTGCQGGEVAGPADGTDRFVFQTDREIVLVDGVTVVARLPRGSVEPGAARIPVTKDGRYLYAVGESSISVLDTRSLDRRELPCDTPCPRLALGSSLIGRFDTGSESDTGTDETTSAAVRVIDLAAAQPAPGTLGHVQLPRPHPADSRVVPYSYFLDAAPGEYLFFDPGPEHPATPRAWEYPQRLYRARLDGATTDLGRYGGFGREIDVWAVMSPDGDRVVLNSAPREGDPGRCTAGSDPGFAPLDMVDLVSGHKSRIHPPTTDPGQRLRATRAWWGNNGTAYVAYARNPCGDGLDGQPPSVWAYRDGSWSQLDTGGPAILALPLAGGRLAVVAPGGETAEVPRGTLSFVDAEGHRTHIADGVTAIAPLPPHPDG